MQLRHLAGIEYGRDLLAREPHVAVPTLRAQHDQLGIEQLRDVRARGLRAARGRRHRLH